MDSNSIDYRALDPEWRDLILSALELGISSEEIREFLNEYPNLASTKSHELTK